jgi:hypothetical protein
MLERGEDSEGEEGGLPPATGLRVIGEGADAGTELELERGGKEGRGESRDLAIPASFASEGGDAAEGSGFLATDRESLVRGCCWS